METFHQFISAIDFSQVLIRIFPAIINPVTHGFQNLFVLLFTSLKNIVEIHPGLISGTFFMSMVYITYNLLTRPKKTSIPLKVNK